MLHIPHVVHCFDICSTGDVRGFGHQPKGHARSRPTWSQPNDLRRSRSILTVVI